MEDRRVLRVVLVAVGLVVILPAAVLGLLSLASFVGFFAKVAVAIIIGAAFWIAVLLITLRLTRRSH